MPSSLATQLAQSSSLNTSLLLERTRTRHKHSVQSYLFTGREAVEHDLDSIYALGRNGFEALIAIDKSTPWEEYEEVLFSHAARRVDRTLLTTEEVHRLDVAVAGFLGRLGPHLMSMAAGKTLEWLVRRFRINEFNFRAVLALFLPYHETPHFVKMLSILKFEGPGVGPFGFLKAYAEATKPLPRIKLVEEMRKESDVARFVVGLLGNAKVVHRTLVAFYAATLHDFIVRAKVVDEETMAFVLPALLEPLMVKRKGKKGKNWDVDRERDVVLTSYVLLAALSRMSERRMAPQAIRTIVSAVVAAATKGEVGVTPRQLVNVLVTVCEPQNELGGEGEGFEEKTVERLISVAGIADEFRDALSQGFVGVNKVVHPMLHQLIKRLHTPEAEYFLESLIIVAPPSSPIPRRITSALLPLLTTKNQDLGDAREPATRLLAQLHQRFPGILRTHTAGDKKVPSDPGSASGSDAEAGAQTEAEAEVVEELIIKFESLKTCAHKKGQGKNASSTDDRVTQAILKSTNADSGVRIRGVRDLIGLQKDVGEEGEGEEVRNALFARIQDTSLEVVEALYESGSESETGAGVMVSVISSGRKRYLDLLEGALVPIVGGTKKKDEDGQNVQGLGKGAARALIKAHLGFLVKCVLHSGSFDEKGFVEEAFHRIVFPFLLHSKPRGKTAEGIWGILFESKGKGMRWIRGCADVVRRAHSEQEGEDEEDEMERLRKVNGKVVEKIAENILASSSVSTEMDTLLRHLDLQSTANPCARLLALLVMRALLRQCANKAAQTEIQLELTRKVVDLVHQGVDKWNFNVSVDSEEALVEMLSPISLDRSVISKPNNKTTEALLWVSLLSDVAGISKLKRGGNEEVVDWIGQESRTKNQDNSTKPSYAYAYPDLIRSIYELTPSFASTFADSSAQAIKMLLLRTIFTNLGNDTMLLLAGIWLRLPESSSSSFSGLGATALLHATAFLEAHASSASAENENETGSDVAAVDFQIVVPALVVALASRDKEVRRGAGRCLEVIGRISGLGGEMRRKVNFGGVYAFDVVYGSGSDKVSSRELQYLSPEDFTTYLGALLDTRDHFAHDTEGEYVSAFHGEHLSQVGDRDKEKYQGNVLCFLLSHVNAITLPSAQAALLKIISPIANTSIRPSQTGTSSSPSKSQSLKVKAQAPLLLVPLLRVLADKSTKELAELYGEYTGEIAALGAEVVFGFGSGIILNDESGQKEDVWELFCRLLKRGISSTQRQNPFLSLRQTLSTLILDKGLWSALKRERKLELCKVILDAGVRQEGAEEVCKTFLRRVLCTGADAKQQVYVITQLLDYLRAELAAVSEGVDTPRASKRAKLDKAPLTGSREDEVGERQAMNPSPFARLAFLAEVLASLATRVSSDLASAAGMALPSSFELITHLLEMLSRVVQWPSSGSTARAVAGMVPTSGTSGSGSGVGYVGESDVTFVQQNLMAAVEVAASGVKEAPNLAPNAIRLDVLVDLIRVTSNPQTFHQALLLIANLARLAPESVLRNIMPVFTFMGSNVFHRDDTYSFAVVQKTVDNIVPVMVASLKQAHTAGGLEMYIGARDFLRVFTDAANHIPRHRRTNFFAHLVDVLGPKEFLTPICLLLVEKSANKIIRSQQNQGKDKDGLKDDVQGALGLPTMLVHYYAYDLQVWVLAEMLRESERLARRVIDPENTTPTFLDDSLLEEHSISPAASYKRRSQAIVAFAGHAAKVAPSSTPESDGGRLSDALALLISLSTMKSGDSVASKVEDIVKTARSSMRRVLNVMAAKDFVDAVLSMISLEDKTIQEGALDLLSFRLANVSTAVRQAVTPSIVKIIECIGKLLLKQPPRSLSIAALNSVKSIGNTLCAGEENALTSLVPTIIAAIRARDVVAAAISALVPLPNKLGPRLIPHFREIVSQAIVLLREGQEGIMAETVNVLLGLLSSIPTFWSKTELSQVIKLFLDLSASVSRIPDDIARLAKAMAKRVPAKLLLPTLCEAWRPLELSPNMGGLVGFFDLLKRALHSSDRPAVQDNLRAVFNIFLGAFGIIKGSSPNLEDPKTHAIAAFVELVVKLNEPTFRGLFRRLYDWAFASDKDAERETMFCDIYNGLLDFFKALMNPYMSMLTVPLVDILKGFAAAESINNNPLLSVLGTFNKSLSCDDGSFWRDDKIRQLTPSLIAQVPICVKLNTTESKTLLQDCLTAAAEIATDDGILKSMNLDILMYSRSEDARTRLFALNCSEALWRTHGGKLLGFVAETATFIAECCEDENDMVAKESFKLKNAVESVAGSINGI